MSETQVTTEVQFEDADDLDAFSDGFYGKKSAESTETKVEAAQGDSSSTTVDTQAQNDDEQDEAELHEEIPEKPKRKTVQDRIDEVVRQREEQKRESQAAIAKLQQEIDALKKGPTTQEVVSPEEPTPDAIKDDGSPVYALGEFDPQYIRDLTKFTLQQERVKVQAEMAETQRQSVVQQEQQTLQTSWNDKVATATQEYPDFVEKGQEMLANFTDLDQNYAGYLTNVLMSMEKGPEVLYYLSNHPEEAISIVNSGAQRATLALGRIESRFLQNEQQAPKIKVTQAAPPPVARARGTNGAFIAVAPDTDDLEAFEKEFFKPRRY
jgi:hypothetical protein